MATRTPFDDALRSYVCADRTSAGKVAHRGLEGTSQDSELPWTDPFKPVPTKLSDDRHLRLLLAQQMALGQDGRSFIRCLADGELQAWSGGDAQGAAEVSRVLELGTAKSLAGKEPSRRPRAGPRPRDRGRGPPPRGKP